MTSDSFENLIPSYTAGEEDLEAGSVLVAENRGDFSAPSVKGEKVKRFFAANWLYFAAFFTVFISFFITLAAYNAYPFPEKKAISNYDLLAQICPFIEHFYDVFSGKSTLFYTTAVMGGADIFGSLAYCCISPFTFVFLLFGKGNVYYATSFVLPLKLACIAFSAIYFIKKNYKNIPDFTGLIIALLYAYCGYTFVADTYINWLDFLIYMPFVITGFSRLVKEKKIRYFAVSYALMIYACFSIASFALLLVYLIFLLYAFICAEKTERKTVVFKMCLSLVLAVGLALPVMLPSFLAYIRSARNTGLFGNMNNALTDKPIKIKLTYVIADVGFLFFNILYFIKNRFKNRKSVFFFLSGLIILAPVLIDEVCLLLNAGSYMSYALRFGFLNSAFAFYLCCETLNDGKDESIKKNKKIIFSVVFSVLALAAAAGLIYNAYMTVENGEDKFSADFVHSLGGISVIGVTALIILGILIVAFVFYKFKLTDRKFLSLALTAVFVTQISVYNVYLVKGNIFDPVRYDRYNEIVDIIDETYETDGYYRIKDYDDSISAAAPFTTHTNSFSVFSSVIDAANLAPTNFFGYAGNKINSIKSKGGLFFGDALLGYKYYFVNNGKNRDAGSSPHSAQKRTYNELLEDTALPSYQAVKNDLCFPYAFTVDSDKLVFGDDYFENMTVLYNFLGGEGELFDEFEIATEEIVYDKDADVYMAKIYTKAEGQWYMTHAFPEDYEICYSLSAYKEDNKKELKSDSVINFNYNKNLKGNYFYCYMKNYNDRPFGKEEITTYCKGACLPLKKIEDLRDKLFERAAEYEIENGDTFVVKANAEEGSYLVMNYIALDGFDIKVNGKSAEFEENALNFMVVKLDEGENDVVIKYNSPYVLYMLLGILAAAVICFAVRALNRSEGKFGAIAKTAVFIAAIGLGALVFGFFIGYPTVVFMKKLFLIIF